MLARVAKRTGLSPGDLRGRRSHPPMVTELMPSASASDTLRDSSTMRRFPSCTALLIALMAPAAAADELHLLPATARLEGPHARQRFLVELRDGAAWVADRGAEARFAVDNPRVAAVADDGTVTPVGN